MSKVSSRSDKLKDLMEQVKLCIDKGNYRFSNHALERKQQRALILSDILYILRNGYHEKVKDTWDEERRMWKYSIRGKTIDMSESRIIITIDQSGMLIITVIRLNAKEIR